MTTCSLCSLAAADATDDAAAMVIDEVIASAGVATDRGCVTAMA
jgi:hypothetical protein